jgi:hypothetical protein
MLKISDSKAETSILNKLQKGCIAVEAFLVKAGWQMGYIKVCNHKRR